jgi:Aspartyl protease
MTMPVQVNLGEYLATSGDVSSWMIDATRRRRKPVDVSTESAPANPAAPMMSPATPIVSTAVPNVPPIIPITAETDMAFVKPLYACPSGRVRAWIEGDVSKNALLDNGSEVNIMPRRTFEELDPMPPIDTDIKWKISSFNTGSETEADGVIGVCHAVDIDIGGVNVKVPIFIMEHCNQDLLLGRPWERMVRAQFTNEDDGSLVVKIKSLDGRKHAEFVAVQGDHERNRAFVRLPENAWVSSLKA